MDNFGKVFGLLGEEKIELVPRFPKPRIYKILGTRRETTVLVKSSRVPVVSKATITTASVGDDLLNKFFFFAPSEVAKS